MASFDSFVERANRLDGLIRKRKKEIRFDMSQPNESLFMITRNVNKSQWLLVAPLFLTSTYFQLLESTKVAKIQLLPNIALAM